MLLTLVTPCGATPAEWVWRPLGPPIADVLDLAAPATTGSTLIAATAGGGLFTSSDTSASWSSAGEPVGLDPTVVHVDAAAPWEIVVGTQEGRVHRSFDDGASWTEISQGLPEGVAINDLARTGSGELLVAGAGSGVRRLVGASWQPSSTGLGSAFVEDLEPDPHLTSRLWAGTAAGVYRSDDAGATWISASTGIGSLLVRCLLADSTQPGRLWAGTAGSGIFLSTDGGSTWSADNGGVGDPQVRALLQRGTLLAAASGSRVLTRNVAVPGWTPLGEALASTVRSLEDLGGTWFAGSAGSGVFRFDPGAGASGQWTPRNQGLEAAFALAATAAAATDQLFVGTSGAGVWSFDRGDWETRSQGLASNFVTALAEDPVSGRLYAATAGSGVQRSDDLGASWLPPGTGISGAFVRRVRRSATADLLAATSSGVLRSSDHGQSWQSSGLPGVDVRALVAAPVDSAHWLAGASSGALSYSIDDGASWAPFGDVGAAARDLSYGGDLALWVASESGVWSTGPPSATAGRGDRSTVGATGALPQPCGLDGERVTAIREHDGAVWAATLDTGVWRLTQCCSDPDWAPAGAGMPQTGVYALDLVPSSVLYGPGASGETLIASTYGGGVFVLEPVTPLFADGFESGDVSAWTSSTR
ncbi:MAG: hypothetical protein DWQ30_17100 [Acidobacteria bacterium]|nr:MAG: hypothetical protein DWQ30_17100 [Acidobacteriota bacterium]